MKIQIPASHKDDPDSAIQAEVYMNQSGKRFTHQETVTAFVKAAPGRTAAEIGYLSGMGHIEAQRRLSDCSGVTVVKGKIKKCPINKTSMVTWYPTEDL